MKAGHNAVLEETRVGIAAVFHVHMHTSKVLPMKSGGTLKLCATKLLFLGWTWESGICLPVVTARIHIYRESEEDEYSVVCQIQHVAGTVFTITLKHLMNFQVFVSIFVLNYT